MSTSFPSGVDAFSTKVDRGIVYHTDINNIQDAVMALETFNRPEVTGTFNVLSAEFGADRTGTTFSTDAFQAAIDAAKAVSYGPGNNTHGAVVEIPAGYYKIDDTLDLDGCRGVMLRGTNYYAGTTSFSHAALKFTKTDRPLIDVGSTSNDQIVIENLSLIGSQGSTSGANNANICIFGTSISGLTLRGLNIYAFGGAAVKLISGFGFRMFNSQVTGSYFDYDSLAAPGGIIWIDGGEPFLDDVNCNGPFPAGTTGHYDNGYLAAYYFNGAPVWIRDCNAAFASVGYHFSGNSWNSPSLISNCRSEFNQGHGWVIEGGDFHLSNCTSFDNGLSDDAVYSGFLVDRDGAASGYPIRNMFVNCISGNYTSPGSVTNTVKYGFTDDAAGVADISAYGNRYVNCAASGFDTTGRIFNFTGNIKPIVSPSLLVQAGSLNTTPSPDELTFDGESGVTWRAAIASGAATLIKATNLIPGQIYTLYIVQHATAGTVTLDTVFSKTAAFTSPANSKQLTGQFYSDGTSLYQLGAWSGDM